MNIAAIIAWIRANVGVIDVADAVLGCVYASLPRHRLRLRVQNDRIAWAYEERFDRWANSRDAVTAMPRDEQQLSTMAAYLSEGDRWKCNEAFVSYREAKQWSRRTTPR